MIDPQLIMAIQWQVENQLSKSDDTQTIKNAFFKKCECAISAINLQLIVLTDSYRLPLLIHKQLDKKRGSLKIRRPALFMTNPSRPKN
jgi:hypothetical protein